MTVIIDPDCAAGKHTNCDGTGWDENTEALADCPCPCHNRSIEDPDCASCGMEESGAEANECPNSKRPCGHHCNHVWSHDECDWCGIQFGESGEESHPQKVRLLKGMPGVSAGRIATLHDASPSGHTNAGLKWVDIGEHIQWSFGQSESTGFWAGAGEYELIETPEGGARG
ncbi:hypothetical protein C5E11_03955 [Clavibacter michiganensis]|nr:hypothetical protein [Clavibacter michiganensis]PPF64552.1 hypothetical protein C5E11_03955 [Clavibacter michiganensis]